jgi:hypothetical protein
MIIKVKIDVSKINKAYLFKGAKGTYLDITLLENRDGVDQYGNSFMVVQDVSKADREAGIKGAILGNGKVLEAKGGQPKQSAPVQGQDDGTDSVPF